MFKFTLESALKAKKQGKTGEVENYFDIMEELKNKRKNA